MITLDMAQKYTAAIYDALVLAEAAHPKSPELAVLHRVMAKALKAAATAHGVHPSVIHPASGTNKPPA